jgi:hypothetical protein
VSAVAVRYTTLAAEFPVLRTDCIKVPVLPADRQGAQANNVPSELVIIKDSDHGLIRPVMRLALCTKLEAFLAANPGPP